MKINLFQPSIRMYTRYITTEKYAKRSRITVDIIASFINVKSDESIKSLCTTRFKIQPGHNRRHNLHMHRLCQVGKVCWWPICGSRGHEVLYDFNYTAQEIRDIDIRCCGVFANSSKCRDRGQFYPGRRRGRRRCRRVHEDFD